MYQQTINREKTPGSDPIRPPVIETAFQQLEKTVQELTDSWGKCMSRISPIVSQWPANPNKVSQTDSAVPLAARIDAIQARLLQISNEIKECVDHIEI